MSDLRRRRRGRERKRRRKRSNLWLIIGGSLVALFGGIVLFSALAVHSVAEDLNLKDGDLKEIRLGQNTRIYDKNGKLLGIVAGVTNRTVVPSRRIPQVLKDATVAIEDKRFYEHDGVDYYRLLGAAWRDLESGSASQGGSTITMQLIKNLYDPQAGRTLSKKIEEAYLAYQYEERYTKDEILAKYLNGVFYGQNAVGVQAASLTYFDKDVSEINLQQAALLAGLPQAPSSYNPFANPESAKARRNLVLDEMADQGYITQELADKAKKSGLALKRGNAYKAKREEYFFEYVRQLLIDRYGEKRVQQGGFKVYTTIDPALQSAARKAIKENLYYEDDPASAVVMVDSQKGFIRAMASSVRFSAENQFNFATQAERQPGSTFKTFVLTEAIRQGINPYTTLYASKKLDFVDPYYGPIDVSTYSNTYRGAIPIASATLSSDNSVFQQLTLDVGPKKVIQTAYDMGVSKARKLPGRRLHRPGRRRGDPARHGDGVLAALERRLPRDTPRDHQDREAQRRRQRLQAGAQEGLQGRRVVRGHAHPPEQRDRRDRHRRADRRGGGRQDRHHQRLPRRVVRRLHAQVLDRGLGWLSERDRRHAVHDERARDRRGRRHVPRLHLGGLHAGGRRSRRRLGLVPAARRADDLVAVHQRLHPLRRRAGGEPGGRVVGGLDGQDRHAGHDHLPAPAPEQRPAALARHAGAPRDDGRPRHAGTPQPDAAGARDAAPCPADHAHTAAAHDAVGSRVTEGGYPPG